MNPKKLTEIPEGHRDIKGVGGLGQRLAYGVDVLRYFEETRDEWLQHARSRLDVAEAENRDLRASEQREHETAIRAVEEYDSFLADVRRSADEWTRHRQSTDRQRAPYADALNNYGVARVPGATSDMNPTDGELREWILGRSPERHLVVSLPETRDLSVGTATAGGSTVPAGFASRLHSHMIEVAAIRQTNVTVLRTQSGEGHQRAEDHGARHRRDRR